MFSWNFSWSIVFVLTVTPEAAVNPSVTAL
jgi:hypothetical protein